MNIGCGEIMGRQRVEKCAQTERVPVDMKVRKGKY